MKRFVIAGLASVAVAFAASVALAEEAEGGAEDMMAKDAEACHETASTQVPDGDEAAWKGAYEACMKAHGHEMMEGDGAATEGEESAE